MQQSTLKRRLIETFVRLHSCRGIGKEDVSEALRSFRRKVDRNVNLT